MKKNLFIVFILMLSLDKLNAVMVHVNNIRTSVVQAADRYLAQQGFPVADVPPRLMNEYYQKIDVTIDSLRAKASTDGRSYVDDQDIASEIRYQFRVFYENLQTVVIEQKIDSRVTEIIHEVFRVQNIFVADIPSSMRREFQSRREAILRRLRSMMTIDGRDYVRVNEIEKCVREEMSPLIHRAKQQVQASVQSQGSVFWDMVSDFFGGGSSSSPSRPNSSTYGDGRVYRANLEANVLDVVQRHLSRNGINADRVPARVVADYSRAVEHVLSSLRDRMASNGRDFVTTAEIELMVNQRIKVIIDAIKLVGRECSICRDEYFSGQIVGNLSCGHLFHKECVETWFEHRRTCPECSLNVSGILAQEIVP